MGSTDREEAEDRDDIHGEALASRKPLFFLIFILNVPSNVGYRFCFCFSLSLGYLGHHFILRSRKGHLYVSTFFFSIESLIVLKYLHICKVTLSVFMQVIQAVRYPPIGGSYSKHYHRSASAVCGITRPIDIVLYMRLRRLECRVVQVRLQSWILTRLRKCKLPAFSRP